MDHTAPTVMDWKETKARNEDLIKHNLMQIEMAKSIIVLCDLKISEFPMDEIPKGDL